MILIAKKISFGLSIKEINNAIKEIRSYQSDLTYKIDVFTRRLAEEGVKIAQLKIAEHDAVYTGELQNSMNSERGEPIQNGSTWLIYTGCEYAPYVEFGAGIVGSQNPHPDVSLGNWKYDINEHGEKGWFYFNSNDGRWHWTKGMKSRPFMYETGQELRLKIEQIAKEVFGNV